MPLPAGVTTCNLTFGSGLTFAGDNVSVSLTLVPTHSVVWAATGQALVDFPLTVSVAAGVPGSLAVPVVDQAGWIGVDGEAFTMWAYTATLTWRFGSETRAQVKAVQPLTGQATVDLDMVPGGTVTVPVSAPIPDVLSVNGLTGAVVIPTGGASTVEELSDASAVGKSVVKAPDASTARAAIAAASTAAATTTDTGLVELATTAEATAGTDTTRAVTPAGVAAAIAALVASAPSTLNTLDELAAALGDDASFATTVTTALGLRGLKSEGLGVRVKAGGTWPARPAGYATVLSIGADPSPVDQDPGDLRWIPA